MKKLWLPSARQFLLLLALTLVSVVKSEAEIVEGSRGTAYGLDHIFSLKAPNGWFIDTESCASWGVGFCFYPTNTSLADSSVVMYARGVSKKDANYKSEQDVIEFTLNDFHNNGSPNYHVEMRSDHKIANDRNAVIVYFSGDQWGNYEAVGYLNEAKSINFLVMSAKSKEAFDQSVPAFYQVLESYQFETELPECAKKVVC